MDTCHCGAVQSVDLLTERVQEQKSSCLQAGHKLFCITHEVTQPLGGHSPQGHKPQRSESKIWRREGPAAKHMGQDGRRGESCPGGTAQNRLLQASKTEGW